MTADGAPRRAVVTGASRGLGAVVARVLADDGYELLLTARGAPPLEAVAAELRGHGATVSAVSGDVTDPELRARVGETVRRAGALHLLVNNASELGPSPLPPLERYPLGELDRVFRVNVLAPLAWVQELVEPLAAARGLVVNISSDAAVAGYPGWGGYGSSKAALDLLSKTLASELSPRGIAVVSVDPGDLRTAMHQAAFPGEDISDRPLPSVTVPFWQWLLHQEPGAVSGGRFRAQADRWEVVR
jgi:NAD(P)-dependent dehydrogenase (short-subunit alcohol dehydrogenase family)